MALEAVWRDFLSQARNNKDTKNPIEIAITNDSNKKTTKLMKVLPLLPSPSTLRPAVRAAHGNEVPPKY